VHGRDDIAEAMWVKLSDITANRSMGRQDRDTGKWRFHYQDAHGQDYPIRDDLGEAIDMAATRLGINLKEATPSPQVGAGVVNRSALNSLERS
jgi:hypothetical protein